MPKARISPLFSCNQLPDFASIWLLIIGGQRFVPLSKTGAEMLFEIFSLRFERGATIVTSNLPFNKWTGVLGSERLTGALLDRLTHHVHILEISGERCRLKESKRNRPAQPAAECSSAPPPRKPRSAWVSSAPT